MTALSRGLPRLAGAAAALALFAATARAEQPRLPPADPRQAIGAVTENDTYVGTQDRWYTNGLRLSWASAEDALPAPLAWLDARLAALFGEARSRWDLALTQTMYTPVDLNRRDPDPRDRPYAGYLYASIGLERRAADHLDRFALQLGVIGPASLAGDVQVAFHRAINRFPPQGCDFQLKNEAMLNLSAERIWRTPLGHVGTLDGVPLELDALPALNLALGTALIQAGAGARLRLGQGLDRDFGPPRIQPATGNGGPPVGEGVGWYVFIGAYGRAVAHDVLLDGNITRTSRSVPRQTLVGDLEAGAALLFGGTRLSFSWVLRSHEFQGQRGVHQFGSIALTTAF